ncbi:mechanosensitive ion channel family protein [Thalassotalea sp. G2M2-11]|uniref:mechanosensitive ion channel family protein n=1 Tax=Thalassotalea sp. G2M2-11 TaxID=2787627 RepID=UPI0019D08CF8|nr:mechanosensitive ion channel family protein [Thalassotalea sp. G2M2-11]
MSAEQPSTIVDKTSGLLKDEIEQVTGFYQLLLDFFANYSFQLVGAFIIFLLGYYIAGKFAKVVLRLCENQQLDVTLSRFLANTTKMLVVVMVTIVALSKLGISITPFIAAIGAISLGASLAFQGLLANYAAGFNIILIRPFVVGDTITVQGVKGIVQEVLLAYTIIKDEDEVEITIPNKHIVGEVLHNSKSHTLLEMKVGISYQDDPVAVIALVEKTLQELAFCDEASKLQVGIDEFADSAINIGIRLWIPTSTLYQTKYQGYKAIYQAFSQHNVTIPFPQRDVHLIEKVD